MIKNQQYYVLKLSSSFLRKKKYKVDISFDEASKSGQVVQLGDSAVLREIRKVTNHNVNLSDINLWMSQRNKLKAHQKSKENGTRINEISNKINNALYIPEYVSIVIDNINHYEHLNNFPLIINGKEYVRLLCSTGGARHNTAVFIDKSIYDVIDTFITNDAKEIEISPAKYNAYYALCSSASIPVSWINFCVIPDYKVTRSTKVEYVNESDTKGVDDSVSKIFMDCEFNIWDGMGIISPDGALQWASDLDLDYLPSAFCIRNSYLKGMVCVFDIHEFLRTQTNNNKIIDVWGNEVDLNNVNMICTESQLKLWNGYNSIEHYINSCKKNGYSFSITKVTPKKDRDYAYLNYQFIQATKQDKETIKDLCKDTVDYFKKLIYDDNNYLRIYCLGKSTEKNNLTKDFFYSLQPQAQAILLSDKFIDDPYIKNWLIQSINKKIKESYIGVLLVNGNFQVAISDPYAFMEYACGMEVRGLLKESEVYCDYWYKKDVNKVTALRAPLTWRSEVNVVNIKNNEDIDDWYKYIYSGIVYNIHGVDCMLQADSD